MAGNHTPTGVGGGHEAGDGDVLKEGTLVLNREEFSTEISVVAVKVPAKRTRSVIRCGDLGFTCMICASVRLGAGVGVSVGVSVGIGVGVGVLVSRGACKANEDSFMLWRFRCWHQRWRRRRRLR